jgi:hypothetical protein
LRQENTSRKFPNSEFGPIVEPQVGLLTLPKAKQILYTSIKKSFEMVEDSPTGNLFHTMCSRSRVSEIELLTNYQLFEKSLRQTLYDGAEIILDILKEEMLQYVAIKNQTLTINDILEEINSKDGRKDKRQKDKRANTVLVKDHNTQHRIPQKQFNSEQSILT